MHSHNARHQLPISNGYGSGMGGIEVYCGRCDGLYRPDAEWVARYFAARRSAAARESAAILAAIAQREAEVLAELAAE